MCLLFTVFTWDFTSAQIERLASQPPSSVRKLYIFPLEEWSNVPTDTT